MGRAIHGRRVKGMAVDAANERVGQGANGRSIRPLLTPAEVMQLALDELRVEFPANRFLAAYEYPTIIDRAAGRHMRADISLFDRESLCWVALVEVGDLTSEDKLPRLRALVPDDVRVIWIPKHDLWHPSDNAFRLPHLRRRHAGGSA